MVFDSVVFWLTFYKTIRSAIEMKRLGMTGSLTYCVLRDGIMYYVGRLSLTIFALVTFGVKSTPAGVEIFSAILANILANVMINHLMLNLRQISNSQPDGGLEQTLTFPEPVFAANSFIGNLGAPLRENSEEIEREIDVFDGYEMHAHTKNNVRGSEHGDLGKTLHHEEEGWHCV